MKRKYLIGLGVVLLFASGAQTKLVQKQNVREVLYLSDTGKIYDGKTTLFRVDLKATTGTADLLALPDVGYGPGAIPFDHVVAFGCNPDGTKIYCIESEISSPYFHFLGVYDIESSTFIVLGLLEDMDFRTQQAAFSPDGFFYIGNASKDELWVVDTDPGSPTYLQVSRVGEILNQATSIPPNVAGADIVFASDGSLFLWVNNGRWGAPRGLYSLVIPEAADSVVWATHLGQLNAARFTGMAIRANGYGDLIGSITSPMDSIFVIDRATASEIASFPMYKDGLPYTIYRFGDMSVGPQRLCNKTKGYWKNHSWMDVGITICDILVEEEEGKKILWNARGRNYSMLFAQLIAAKLNTNNSTGIAEIDDAESYICARWSSGWQDHVYDRIPKREKSKVVALWKALDKFNNQFPCE
jgi:hypothetical protein